MPAWPSRKAPRRTQVRTRNRCAASWRRRSGKTPPRKPRSSRGRAHKVPRRPPARPEEPLPRCRSSAAGSRSIQTSARSWMPKEGISGGLCCSSTATTRCCAARRERRRRASRCKRSSSPRAPSSIPTSAATCSSPSPIWKDWKWRRRSPPARACRGICRSRADHSAARSDARTDSICTCRTSRAGPSSTQRSSEPTVCAGRERRSPGSRRCRST